MLRNFSLLCFCFLLIPFLANFAVAAEPPTTPPPGEDMILTGGKSAKDFFSARAANKDCRDALKASKQTYRAAKKALDELVQKKSSVDAIDAQEAKVDESRDELLAKIEECGECATRQPEKRPIHIPGDPTVWFIADGSCQMEETDRDKLKASFDRISEKLLQIRKYPKHMGGFRHVLELIGVEHETGKLLPDMIKADKSPFYALIAIKGPQIVGPPFSFSYYFKTDYELREREGRKEFLGTFSTLAPAEGFKPPAIYVTRASKRRSSTKRMHVKKVIGSWYVTSEGYIRYYTAADFGVSLPFAAKLARTTLLDTLTEIVEKALPEGTW